MIYALFKNRDIARGISLFFKMLFHSKETARKEGLDHLADVKEKIPMTQLYGVIRQLENADPAGQTLSNKMMGSIVSGELRRKLTKEYTLTGNAKPEGFTDAPADTTVEQTVRDYAAGKPPLNADTILAELRAEEDDKGEKKPLILGALRPDAKIPKDCRVFFDAKGYPVWISFQKTDVAHVPAVPIYKRREKIVDKQPNEERADALAATIQPGDILLTSPTKNGAHHLYDFAIKAAGSNETRTAAGAINHSMVVDANRNIHHMNPTGWEEGSAAEVFLRDGKHNRYKSVTIVRMPEAQRKQYAENLQKSIETYKANAKLKYGTDFKKIAWNKANGKEVGVDDNNPNTCICTDPPREAAVGLPGLEDIANTNVPAKMLSQHVIASFEFDR